MHKSREAGKSLARASPGGTAYYLVWAVWAGMLALFLWSYLPISSPVPLAEDWYTVPLVTGHQVDLTAWLWEQNNEHRMPVARLLLLGALKASRGDYRAGGLLNLALLATVAAGLMLFVRHLRGGITEISDAFFPLTLLHFGHSVDALFPFQITYVLSLAVIIALGCTLFLPQSVSSPRAAAVAGGSLLLLPLSGFIGLLFVPPLAAYLFHAGWCTRSGARGWRANRPVGNWLLFASAATVALAALYFVGYEHPWWNPSNPGVLPSLKIALKVLSLGFGPAPHFWWAPGVAAAVLFLTASCWVSVRRLDVGIPERDFRMGSTLFLAVAITFAAGTGWGRAGYVPDIGLPLRYVSLVLPAFIASYLTSVGSSSAIAKSVQRGLALTLLLLVPVNTVAGHRLFGDWYHEGMMNLEADLDRGVPIDELAVRHSRFLVHWWPPATLAQHMRMLHDAGVRPFDRAVTLPSMPR
ncbi:MAG: hypothetical protein ABIS06_09895 [Vicinamibacterales bacterium]